MRFRNLWSSSSLIVTYTACHSICMSLLFPTLDGIGDLNKGNCCCSSTCTLCFLSAVVLMKRVMTWNKHNHDSDWEFAVIHPDISDLYFVCSFLQWSPVTASGSNNLFTYVSEAGIATSRCIRKIFSHIPWLHLQPQPSVKMFKSSFFGFHKQYMNF